MASLLLGDQMLDASNAIRRAPPRPRRQTRPRATPARMCACPTARPRETSRSRARRDSTRGTSRCSARTCGARRSSGRPSRRAGRRPSRREVVAMIIAKSSLDAAARICCVSGDVRNIVHHRAKELGRVLDHAHAGIERGHPALQERASPVVGIARRDLRGRRLELGDEDRVLAAEQVVERRHRHASPRARGRASSGRRSRARRPASRRARWMCARRSALCSSRRLILNVFKTRTRSNTWQAESRNANDLACSTIHG